MGFMRQGFQNMGRNAQGMGQNLMQGYNRLADPRLGMQAGPPSPMAPAAPSAPAAMGEMTDKTMPGIPPMHGIGPNAQVPREEAPGMAGQGRKLGLMLRSLLPGGMKPREAMGMGQPSQNPPVQDIQGFKWSRGTMGANRSY